MAEDSRAPKQHGTKPVKVKIDAEAALLFDKMIREGLVASEDVSDADNKNFTLTARASAPKTIEVELDPAAAALFDELIRKGLVASEAVSDADNKNFTLSLRPPDKK